MSNSSFRFKQFTIHQDRCAMKVSTDACLQGALTPVNGAQVHRALDIGAGTGLLSLMLAQRLPNAIIDAIEMDEDAALQATENVCTSPFSQRIRVIHADAASWQRASELYDLIICNPPFFSNSLRGPDAARNAARHTASLNTGSLCSIISKCIARDGTASVMWPRKEHPLFVEEAMKAGLHLKQIIELCDSLQSPVKRIISIWTKNGEAETIFSRFVLKEESGEYSEEAVQVLSPFYLRL